MTMKPFSPKMVCMGRYTKDKSGLLFPLIFLNVYLSQVVYEMNEIKARHLRALSCGTATKDFCSVPPDALTILMCPTQLDPSSALASLTDNEPWDYPCFEHFVPLWSHPGLKVNTSQTREIKENMYLSYSFHNRIFSSWLPEFAFG